MSRSYKKLIEALEAQIIEYESRGQVLYAGLGAPSSIRLVYDLLGKEKPTDLPAIKNPDHENVCEMCGDTIDCLCRSCEEWAIAQEI